MGCCAFAKRSELHTPIDAKDIMITSKSEEYYIMLGSVKVSNDYLFTLDYILAIMRFGST